ncbi:hypothetical protein N801_07345 [Knoellia aerolata DSM 18566]|uniref:Uncharacterized protein n=1 Tax=Knoellia aerolata DSM 18566 TaxID=1385519 RepID=A0A0A0JWE1_9MICO|nr:hypothetical protein N801_07345 [Knoellia aerolata DSM 18566]
MDHAGSMAMRGGTRVTWARGPDDGRVVLRLASEVKRADGD